MATKAGEAKVSDSDLDMIEQIGRGEETAFVRLVDAHGAALLRMASYHAPSRAVAEEVVQETWMAFLQGLDGFERRSTLRTWLFGILINQARKIAKRERRTVLLYEAEPATGDEHGVDTQRFMPADGRWAGHWRLDDLSVWPRSWTELPEHHVLRKEVEVEIVKALEPLPPAQQVVFTLRDIEGLAAQEACSLLGISDANQRILLHRARCKVRAHLEAYLNE